MTEQKEQQASPPPQTQLEGGTYEIIRRRLAERGQELRQRIEQLNDARKDVFGTIETQLTASESISTDNNCVPRDMVSVGRSFLFGYNVFIGLRAQTVLEDVFAQYEWADGAFRRQELTLLRGERFETDFRNLYKYYRHTTFAKFHEAGPHLYLVFRTGKAVTDVKTFKFLLRGEALEYVDNRSDHEYAFPPQQEFDWTRVTHDMQRSGRCPHVSIADRVFVETMGGDLTIKIEDNTESGEGIYSEPVDNPDQTLDDAEMYYALVGNLIVLKIRPYQEKAWRHIVYSEKAQQAVRIDSIADACVLLPDGHGLIFPRGCYLQTGELKLFEIEIEDMVFDRRIASPNGEDYLYLFYNRDSGTYVLLGYNVIAQRVATPIVCNGYSLFDDGTLLYFRAGTQPQKHHTLQVWQTPFRGPDFRQEVRTDSHLYRIGNKDIVRCMAECHELLVLLGKEDTYANLYVDIARTAQNILDGYFWLNSPDTFRLDEPLRALQEAAAGAIAEFEKVTRTQRDTRQRIAAARDRVRKAIASIDYYHLDDIGTFVRLLAELRALRGEVIGLKDLRYADLPLVEALEAEVAQHAETLSARCVEFLLQPEALAPYVQRIEAHQAAIPELAKVTDAKALAEQLAAATAELEMLIEIVSNLKIDDATQTTAIIDAISLVLAQLNKAKSALKNRTSALAASEGAAEYASQTQLIDQAVINYLDVCDAPDRCDEYLGKVMVQLETLESRFADFDDFVVQLAQKREEVYGAFESRKAQLVEDRNRRCSALLSAAQRVLKGVRNRAAALATLNEINAYFASDLMIERVRETVRQLRALGDTVKADDIDSQLKSLQQDSARQLKDRQALYEDGESVIRFGRHRFSVNHQNLELTTVLRDGELYLHLTGTGFFERVTDPDLLATRDTWGLECVSESPAVYRSEYLAYLLLRDAQERGEAAVEELAGLDDDALLQRVQAFMAPRYAEGYVKGVHDADAALLLRALLHLRASVGLLAYAPPARALASVYWRWQEDGEAKARLSARLAAAGRARTLFADRRIDGPYIAELRDALAGFAERTRLFDAQHVAPAAEYLYHALAANGSGPSAPAPFALSAVAAGIRKRFESHLRHRKHDSHFTSAAEALADDLVNGYRLRREWVASYLGAHGSAEEHEFADEVAAALLDGQSPPAVIDVPLAVDLEGLAGSHPRIQDGKCRVNYGHFLTRLQHHEREVAPKFRAYVEAKKRLLAEASEAMRLDEYQARVLTTFVRNKLIDKVFLPLVGDNLAKQIGTVGQDKRTDRQGLLLLISPPGYGKTTLMAYVANRLGLIFVKVNGPAIGHRVTSLDPSEAPNASARSELEKINLAFEMGDNVMIYLDDIQHCHPELLQKFIPLCDATRRVEGVYKGRTKTYDLRGKRVCVVMAGNPFTESGERFQVPDMLTNRADTYNIGDIVGDNRSEFELSVIENCLTSNPILAPLMNRSQEDVYALIRLTETGEREGIEFEGAYSPDELNEYVSVLRKLFIVRDVVLKMNAQYIASAGTADEYRTEPPFLLQGSYRNMNRIASRVLPVMNDAELWTLIESSYEQDAQTLTTSAEANLLRFRELVGRQTPQQAARLEEIRKTFRRNLLLGGESDDKFGTMIRQLNAFSAGLDSIRDVLAGGVGALAKAKTPEAPDPLRQTADAVLGRMDRIVTELREQRKALIEHDSAQSAADAAHAAAGLTGILEEQFRTMETWLRPVARTEAGRAQYANDLVRRFEDMIDGYSRLVGILKERQAGHDADEADVEITVRSGDADPQEPPDAETDVTENDASHEQT